MKKQIGFYYTKAITQAGILIFLAILIFPAPYRELSFIVFLIMILMAVIIAMLIVAIDHLFFKKVFPDRFQQYRNWAVKNSNFWQHKLITLGGYSVLVFLAIECFNQYNVNTPIQSSRFVVTEKKTTRWHHSYSHDHTYYNVIFNSPVYGDIETINKECFKILQKGDTATLFIQGGRLHTFFIRDFILDAPHKNIKC